MNGKRGCAAALRLSAVVLLGGALSAWPSAMAADDTAHLAVNGQARYPVVIGANAAEREKIETLAETLASYLGRISGGTFAVETGDGSGGIVVGVSGDFDKLPRPVSFPEGPLHTEDYVIRSGDGGVWLIGATDLAVQHAVWDLLYRFGYRQFFSGEAWEVVPKTDTLSISIDVAEAPDFAMRDIHYAWGMTDYNTQPYIDWCARNRMAEGFRLVIGHAYGTIMDENRAAFDAHPEYQALVGGKRGGGQLCVANADLRKLIVDWAVRRVKERGRPGCLSMEPNDGDGWCECEPCVRMGSPSDRALTLANEVAVAINALDLGDQYVGMYAYNRHSPPPTIRVHPKVIIGVATAFLRGDYSLDQIMDGWQAQGAELGVYDYYSVAAWDWSMPGAAKTANPKRLAPWVRHLYRKGARYYISESTDAWGPYGLGFYVASRTMWDINEADRVDEIIDDFLTRAFGPAKEPMGAFYHLITEDLAYRSNSDLAGRMYRHLAEAQQRADGHADVQRRIDQLIAYTRFVELKHAGDQDAWLAFTYRMRESSMAAYYQLWSRLLGQPAAHDPKHKLKDDTPLTRQALDTMLAQGIANNRPTERGFDPVAFSGVLVPAAERLKLADVSLGSYRPNAQQSQQYFIWVDTARADFTLKVTVQKVWDTRPHHVRLHAVEADGTKTELTDFTGVKPDGRTYEVPLHTPRAGLHWVRIDDGGDYTRIVWPEGMPLTVDSDASPFQMRPEAGPWTLYCYVPKGTKVIGGWSQEGQAGTLRDADGNVRYDFGAVENGWFRVPVPPGQDGKLWQFEQNQGMRRLMTIPPYLARNGKELLLPREVVERDARWR